MLSIAMIEDHSETARTLQGFIRRFSAEKSIKMAVTHFGNSEDFLDHLADNFDLVLMDIQLPGTDGMSAAKKMRACGSTTALIFITSLAQYAVHGYDVDALDFIVKPVSYYQFAMKMEKACKKITQNLSIQLTISVARQMCIISSSELYYVETERHDLIFHAVGNTYQSRGALSEVESKLSGVHFLRINSCYLINMNYISGLNGNAVIMANGDELFISRARRKEVMSSIIQFLGGAI